MKGKLFAAALLGLGVLSGQSVEKPFSGDARPPRSIQLGSQLIAELKPGIADQAEIVIADGAAAVTRYAGELLAKNLKQILKTDIPTVSKPSGGKFAIYLGISPYSKAAGIQDEKLCRDAFIIKTGKDCVYILGRDARNGSPNFAIPKGGIWSNMYERGTIFGVYDFLERFAGVRFYFPGENGTVYSQKTVRIPQTDIYERPDFESRMVSIYSGQWDDEKKIKPYPYDASISPQKNEYYYSLRLQTKYVPCNHGLLYLGLEKRFGKTHPEYFALRSDGQRWCQPGMSFNGQLCYNSKVTEEIYKDAASLLKGEPSSVRGIISPYGKIWDPTGHAEPKEGRAGVFCMMPQDAYQNCRCPECEKILPKGNQAISNFMWSKVAALAGRLQKEGIPGYVTFMSYFPYHLVPEVELPDNVLVMVAASGPFSHGKIKGNEEDKLIRAWTRKLKQKVWLWNYVGKFGRLNMPGIPAMTPRAIGQYYQHLSKELYGAYMESETDRLLYHYLNYYVFSKVAWNNATDVDALLKEHYAVMYGKAAPVMEQIFDLYEKHWLNDIGGRTIMMNLGPMSAPPSEYELWTNVYSPAELNRLTGWFNQAEKLAASDPAALKRVKYIRANFLDPMLAQAEAYRRRNDAIRGFSRVLTPETPAELWLQPFGKNRKFLSTKVTVQDTGKQLVFTFDCEEPEMASVVAPKRKQDDAGIWTDNSVEIFISPSGGKDYFQFQVNSAGSLTDISARSAGSKAENDYKWNSGAEVKTSVTPSGWQAVIAVDKERLGKFNPDGFTANFTRSRAVKGQPTDLYTWSPFLRRGFCELENFGRFIPCEAGKNIVKDSDFQGKYNGRNVFGAWLSPYNPVADTKITLDASVFVFGKQSIRLQDFKPAAGKLFSIQQQLPQMKPNTRYRLNYYVRGENIQPVRSGGGVTVNIWDAANRWFPQNKLIGTFPWILQTYEFTSSPDTGKNSTPRILLYLLHASGTVWFDGVTLEEIQ